MQVRCLICDEQLVSFAASKALVAVMGRRRLPAQLDGSKLVFSGASSVLQCTVEPPNNGHFGCNLLLATMPHALLWLAVCMYLSMQEALMNDILNMVNVESLYKKGEWHHR